MRILNGQELAGYIEERHVHQVRFLRQSDNVQPKLAIVTTVDTPVVELDIRLKQSYGADIGIDVDIHRVELTAVAGLLKDLNKDNSVHGIVMQLPLSNPSQTETITSLVAPQKDVDALGKNAVLDPATPMAILWLLAGYNVNLVGKNVVLIGHGALVGKPLEQLLINSGITPRVVGQDAKDLLEITLNADIIITATGSPAILTANMIKIGAVIVDAGVASEDGELVGDVAPDVYERSDLTITPVHGGVGPLNVCALFENVIRAARLSTKN